MLMVGGVLYLWVRNAGNSRLAWSSDHAKIVDLVRTGGSRRASAARRS